MLLFDWANEPNALAGARNGVASCPGHLSSVKGDWSCSNLLKIGLVHALLRYFDPVFGYLIWTYANIRHNMHLSPVS